MCLLDLEHTTACGQAPLVAEVQMLRANYLETMALAGCFGSLRLFSPVGKPQRAKRISVLFWFGQYPNLFFANAFLDALLGDDLFLHVEDSIQTGHELAFGGWMGRTI